MNKEIRVIKKEENEIALEEVSKYSAFYKRYGKYAVLLILLFILLIGGTIILNLSNSDDYVLDNPNVNIVFPDGDDVIIDDNISNDSEKPSTNDKPGNNTENKPGNGSGSNVDNNSGSNNVVKDPEDVFNDFFGVSDEVCFKVKEIVLSDKKISYYSDYSVKITYNNGNIVRVLPVDNKYSVDELGNINQSAKKSSIKVTKKEKTNHGTITYYSDHFAEVEENGLDLWVGKKENIKEYYITENKISYSDEVKEKNNFSVTYYNDGTILIESEDKKYLVRDNNDVEITDDGFKFIYNNAASVINTRKLDNGFTILYFSDGGAIIEGPDGNISVRKSNSIVIENNKLIKVKTDNKIKETDKKDVCDKEVIYYKNGTAVIKQDGKVIGYIPDNSDIKPTLCVSEDDIVPVVSTSTPNEGTEINIFADDKALVNYDHNKNDDNSDDDNNNDNNKTSDIMDDKDNIVIENGVVTIIDSNAQNINVIPINITNNTPNNIKIRVVLENSENTTLQNNYFKDIKYKFSEDNLTKSIDNNIWEDKGFILYETELKTKESKDYELGIWLDYAGLENDAMDKYFYGTIKVYCWEQK